MLGITLALTQVLEIAILNHPVVANNNIIYWLVLSCTVIVDVLAVCIFFVAWEEVNLLFIYRDEWKRVKRFFNNVYAEFKIFFILYPIIKGILVILFIIATICTLLHYLVFQYWI